MVEVGRLSRLIEGQAVIQVIGPDEEVERICKAATARMKGKFISRPAAHQSQPPPGVVWLLVEAPQAERLVRELRLARKSTAPKPA